MLTQEFYDDIWKRKGKFKDVATRRSRLDVASQLVGKCQRILDIGCGEGLLATLTKGKYEEFFGVDISQVALEIARSRGVRAFRINIDIEKLAFPDNYFDCVVCLDVIEHVFDPAHLLSEAKRVTADGGSFIISTPNIRHWAHLMQLVVKGRFPKTSRDVEEFDGGHVHYFTYADVEELLRRHEFERIERYTTEGKHILREFRSRAVVVKAMA